MQDVFLGALGAGVIVDLYCRFLLAVDGDVADREVQRTKQVRYLSVDDYDFIDFLRKLIEIQ